jgi:hypothetical protein
MQSRPSTDRKPPAVAAVAVARELVLAGSLWAFLGGPEGKALEENYILDAGGGPLHRLTSESGDESMAL